MGLIQLLPIPFRQRRYTIDENYSRRIIESSRRYGRHWRYSTGDTPLEIRTLTINRQPQSASALQEPWSQGLNRDTALILSSNIWISGEWLSGQSSSFTCLFYPLQGISTTSTNPTHVIPGRINMSTRPPNAQSLLKII